MRIQVKDFMSISVITATADTTVGEIRGLLKSQGIHAIPILAGGPIPSGSEVPIAGIVTATDLCKEIDDNVAVMDVMPDVKVHVIPWNTSAQSAAKMMLKHKVHHLVVMEDGKVVGMISSLDFVKLVALHTLDHKTNSVV